MTSSAEIKLSKASSVSLGLMVVFCVGMVWIGTTTATISTKMETIPVIQRDIRDMKDILSRSNGIQERHDAEIRMIKSELLALKSRPIPPKWFLGKVEDLKREIDEIRKRLPPKMP